jgi:hypothetical protein
MINQYKAPKDKVTQIQNFCIILNHMVMQKAGKTVGAEEVFPLIIYAVVKGNIRKLKSNMNYIQYFRHRTRLESAEDYYFTALSSAIEFIETLQVSKLDINENEFNNLYKMSEIKEAKKLKNPITFNKSKYL